MKTIATLEAELPSGRKIVLRELTGEDELACATEAGTIEGVAATLRYQWSQVMRSLVSIEGTPFDASLTTPDGTRNKFDAKEWALVVDAFSELNRTKLSEVEKFRATFRLSSCEVG